MVNRYATQAGKKYQRDVMKYLRENGWDAENLVLTGAEDEGDVLLRTPQGNTDRYVIECKRAKGFLLGDWTRQAQLERANYAEHRLLFPLSVGFVVVHHARNKPIGGSYVTTTLDEWMRRL